MSSDWRSVWEEVVHRHTMEKDSMGAIIELYQRYGDLDPAERAEANEALLEALREGDEDKRFDALAIIDEFSLREAIPDLRALSARLQFDNSPGAPFEVAKIGRILEKLQAAP